MPVPTFAPVAGVELAATTISAAIALPGAGTTLMVTNTGQFAAFVELGTTAAVQATLASVAVLPGDRLALTVGSATHVAALALAATVGLNIVVGN